MGTTADIQKLVDRMARAKSLTDRAVNTSDKGEAVMNRFEARLNTMDDHFDKIDEYEKQLAAMDQLGNGGPPLTDTFQPVTPNSSASPLQRINDHSYVGKISPATGDPIK